MCGIVGALSQAPVDRCALEAMRDTMAHRGPDHAGLWRSDDARVCLGHRRLAIVDLTPAANQPFVAHDGRFVITFNGEIYNFQALREELMAQGVLFRTRSDTEVLVESFRRWGHRCVDRLSGMFAFAIWDNKERRLLCARDRAGEKPFYYALVGGDFIFASELKALLLWPGFRRAICYPALADYLSLGFIPDPKSIWEGCYKLPAGHSMWVGMGEGSRPVPENPTAYWDLEFDPDGSVADWGPRILETLQSASKEMSFADVPVGAFLSGGVDSSSVTAALCRAGCSVNTFTVGFEEHGYDERPWAREVARSYGTSHVERVVLAEDVEPAFDKILWHYDEPFSDYSYLPTFYLCREARKEITVALSGDGGDELFAGYPKYSRLGLRQSVERLVPSRLSRLLVAGANAILCGRSQRRGKLSWYGQDAAGMLADMFMTGLPLATIGAAARGPLAETLRHYSPKEAVLSLTQKAPPEKVGLVNAMRYLDLKLTLGGDILVKVDRASMAFSLEVRPVYLHHDMMSLACSIPPGLLADRHQTKKALKSALAPWLSDALLYRRKQGFALPLGEWVKGDLHHLLARNNGDNPVDHLLDTALLERMTRAHGSGEADHTSCIHSLLFLKHWLARWA